MDGDNNHGRDWLVGKLRKMTEVSVLCEYAADEIEHLKKSLLHSLYCPRQACSVCAQIERDYGNE